MGKRKATSKAEAWLSAKAAKTLANFFVLELDEDANLDDDKVWEQAANKIACDEQECRTTSFLRSHWKNVIDNQLEQRFNVNLKDGPVVNKSNMNAAEQWRVMSYRLMLVRQALASTPAENGIDSAHVSLLSNVSAQNKTDGKRRSTIRDFLSPAQQRLEFEKVMTTQIPLTYARNSNSDAVWKSVEKKVPDCMQNLPLQIFKGCYFFFLREFSKANTFLQGCENFFMEYKINIHGGSILTDISKIDSNTICIASNDETYDIDFASKVMKQKDICLYDEGIVDDCINTQTFLAESSKFQQRRKSRNDLAQLDKPEIGNSASKILPTDNQSSEVATTSKDERLTVLSTDLQKSDTEVVPPKQWGEQSIEPVESLSYKNLFSFFKTPRVEENLRPKASSLLNDSINNAKSISTAPKGEMKDEGTLVNVAAGLDSLHQQYLDGTEFGMDSSQSEKEGKEECTQSQTSEIKKLRPKKTKEQVKEVRILLALFAGEFHKKSLLCRKVVEHLNSIPNTSSAETTYDGIAKLYDAAKKMHEEIYPDLVDNGEVTTDQYEALKALFAGVQVEKRGT